jgi:hypothetical protein
MGQRLGRFAEAHVVRQNAGQVLFAEELQPGQTLFLIRAQFQAEASRRFDGGDALRRPQALGQRKNIALTTEFPAAGVGEFSQARCVEAGQAQRIAAGEPIKKVDQRCRQRLDAAGRNAQALALHSMQFDAFLVRDAVEFTDLQPAGVAMEEAGEQRRQRQALAFDQNAHVEVEPAMLGFNEIGFPAIDFQHVVAEILGELDLPAALLQARKIFLP